MTRRRGCVQYDGAVEADILGAMTHPRCVGWGEIRLDHHYDNSRPVQQPICTRQLRHAVRLGKPLKIHTREADEDTERILKEEVLREHRVHVHCFTDSPAFAQRLLDWFPNLRCSERRHDVAQRRHQDALIRLALTSAGSTIAVGRAARALALAHATQELLAPVSKPTGRTVSAPIYTSPRFISVADEEGKEAKGKKLPLCHSGDGSVDGRGATTQGENRAEEGKKAEEGKEGAWDASRVMRVARAGRVWGLTCRLSL
ncbi:hypothetical protein MSAN_00171400 [Mycena sanguinolenta]|uniref:Uncharacterized protein n=1 Tax=Mycena sanguinolenta TaxID=230812 RepID=A0A8H6ZHK0_9AGAR|nr:hypothetical protein MSAN_00171400 [Mycena sanguinolenta]